MTLANERVLEISKSITGWLDDSETLLLYRLAQAVPDNGVIVEVGSYQGRSTVVLALGAEEKSGKVYAIDHYNGNGKALVVTADDLAAMKANLQTFNVSDGVEVIVGTSVDESKHFKKQIDLLFLDGSHEYEDVKVDLANWSEMVRGKIAMHDTSGNWPGVSQALDEFVAAGEWTVLERIDATSVLERVNKHKESAHSKSATVEHDAMDKREPAAPPVEHFEKSPAPAKHAVKAKKGAK